MDSRVRRTAFAGKITSIVADKSDAHRRTVTIAQKQPLLMTLWSELDKLPLHTGDAVTGEYDCSGGGFHLVCDAIFRDAAGKATLIISGSGRDTLADGWTTSVGKVVKSEQDVNQKQKSVRREHALDFKKDSLAVTTPPGACARVLDGKIGWLASGGGISWIGVRPPEGIDYSSYSLVRE